LRILGVDCGSRITGYGVIESDGLRHRLIEAGTIHTSERVSMEQRLCSIGRRLREVIAEFKPDCAAVEDVFFSANARSAIKLAETRGVVLFVLADHGLAVGEYSPATVKQSVVGYGKAEKGQVQFMIPSLLDLDGPIASADAADALAVAICHATRISLGVSS